MAQPTKHHTCTRTHRHARVDPRAARCASCAAPVAAAVALLEDGELVGCRECVDSLPADDPAREAFDVVVRRLGPDENFAEAVVDETEAGRASIEAAIAAADDEDGDADEDGDTDEDGDEGELINSILDALDTEGVE